MTSKKNVIWAILIIARSGAGKGTVTNALLDYSNLRSDFILKKSLSDATKPLKQGFVNGQEYNHISPDQFQVRKAHGYYLEAEEYAGNWYGSPVEQFNKNKAAGVITLYDIEVNGAEVIISRIGKEHCLVFRLDVPLDELEKRVIKRGRDSKEEQAARKVADAGRITKMLKLGIPIPYGSNVIPEVAANKIYNHLVEVESN